MDNNFLMSIITKLYVPEDKTNKPYIDHNYSTTNGFAILYKELIHQLYESQGNLRSYSASKYR